MKDKKSNNETLYDRAVRNFDRAKYNLIAEDDDEFVLNLVGYLLQQSLEIYFKHVLEINGIDYPKTHNIRTLMNMAIDEIPEGKLTLYIKEDSLATLELFADTITSWESKTRYIKNYFLDKRQIDIGMKLINKILNKDYYLTKKEDNPLIETSHF